MSEILAQRRARSTRFLIPNDHQPRQSVESARIFPSEAIPVFLLKALQRKVKEPSAIVDSDVVIPDSVLIDNVSLDRSSQRDGEIFEENQQPSDDQLDDSSEPYGVRNVHWSDNKFSMHGSAAWKNAAIMAKGPGGAYQSSYQVYCCAATISMAFAAVGLLFLGAMLYLTIMSDSGQLSASRSAQVLTYLATSASGLAIGSVICMLAALLARAWAFYHFTCCCHGDQRHKLALQSLQPVGKESEEQQQLAPGDGDQLSTGLDDMKF